MKRTTPLLAPIAPWSDCCRWQPIGAIGVCLIALLWFWWGDGGQPALAAKAPNLFEQAMTAQIQGDYAQADDFWGQLLDQYPENPALWSNRGNTRVSAGQLDAAIADYNEAIRLAPTEPDPYLNRGVAEEGLGAWQDAIADYETVLQLSPENADAYNNRGNAYAGLGNWTQALSDYQKSVELNPGLAIARMNAALVQYQLGETRPALGELRRLARRYPLFADVRAALTAVLWAEGQFGEAESHWVAAVGLDGRYRDLAWVAEVRRWPPRMVKALEQFLQLGQSS